MVKAKKGVIRDVAKAICTVVASFPAVEMGPLHYRTLEREKTVAVCQNRKTVAVCQNRTLERENTVAVCQNRGNYDGKMVLTSEGKAELKWWSENVDHMSVRPLIKADTSR